MANPTLNICPQVTDVCITRGDSTPMVFQMQDGAGVDLVITGRTYLFTVNDEENPTSPANQKFQLTGTVATPNVTFTPTVTNTNLTPGDYYFDIQETNGAALRTVAKGTFTVNQDISK